MNLFDIVKAAPADPILGLSEAFKQDPNPGKINLGVGIYQDADGKAPVLPSVWEAEKRLASEGASKSYLPIDGHPGFIKAAQALVFGEGNEMLLTGRVVTAQCPGGTGALRVAAEFIRRCLGERNIWVSNPTWDNHRNIFRAADLNIQQYPYYDPVIKGLNLSGMLTVLEDIPENDAVLFHACCHNPTGTDPQEDDWETIAKICKARNLLPIVDFAYQGFAGGIVSDALAVRAFSEYGLEFLVCSSFAKNFGLYQERLGALHLVAKNTAEAKRVMSQIKAIIRTIYSNPPAHGARIVATILEDRDLRMQWEEELKGMRDRLRDMRRALVEGLAHAGMRQDFGYIREQKGMFSYSGLSDSVVESLRKRHSIYIVSGGRINVAGLNAGNVTRACEAIADCVQNSGE